MWVFLGSVFIACGALVGIYLTFRADRARDREQAERTAAAARDLAERNHEATLRQSRQEAMAPSYAEILQVIWDVTNPPRGGQVKSDEVAKRMFKITQTLAVWGSDRSVCAWRDWRIKSNLLASTEGGALQILDEFDNLLRTVREDMGHENVGIAPPDDAHFGDLMGLFLTDAQRPRT
jgi:hypothetical protein